MVDRKSPREVRTEQEEKIKETKEDIRWLKAKERQKANLTGTEPVVETSFGVYGSGQAIMTVYLYTDSLTNIPWNLVETQTWDNVETNPDKPVGINYNYDDYDCIIRLQDSRILNR